MRNRKTKICTSQALRRFCRGEDGSFTLEAVIWMPIFAILLAIVMNLSMVFFYESQMLRITQDATRAFSLGRFTEAEAEQYIIDRLDFIEANITVDVRLVDMTDSAGVIDAGAAGQAVVSTTAAELMPFSLMSGPFSGIPIGVSTQFLIEY